MRFFFKEMNTGMYKQLEDYQYKKIYLCRGNKIDKDPTHPWKIEDLRFEQRGPKSYLLHSGDAVLEKNV